MILVGILIGAFVALEIVWLLRATDPMPVRSCERGHVEYYGSRCPICEREDDPRLRLNMARLERVIGGQS